MLPQQLLFYQQMPEYNDPSLLWPHTLCLWFHLEIYDGRIFDWLSVTGFLAHPLSNEFIIIKIYNFMSRVLCHVQSVLVPAGTSVSPATLEDGHPLANQLAQLCGHFKPAGWTVRYYLVAAILIQLYFYFICWNQKARILLIFLNL